MKDILAQFSFLELRYAKYRINELRVVLIYLRVYYTSDDSQITKPSKSRDFDPESSQQTRELVRYNDDAHI